MTILHYEEDIQKPINNSESDSQEYLLPLLQFAWQYTNIGDVAVANTVGVWPNGKSFKNEVIAARVGQNTIVMTTKPMSTSLINDGSSWRTGPYAICHANFYQDKLKPYDYASFTIYLYNDKPYIIVCGDNIKLGVIKQAAKLIRVYALQAWFK